MKTQNMVAQFFSYTFFFLAHAIFFTFVKANALSSIHPIYLLFVLLFFVVAVWISSYTGDFYIVFFSFIIWAGVSFFQFSSFGRTMETNVSIGKWGALFLVVGTCAVAGLSHKKHASSKHPFYLRASLLAFLTYLMLSSLLSSYPIISFIRTFGFIAVAVFAYQILPREMNSTQALRKLYFALWLTMNGMVGLTALSFLEMLPNYSYMPGRFQGFFANPNSLGPWMNLAFMINLYFFSQRKIGVRMMSGVFGALALFLLFHSNSRANYLGLLIGFILFLFFSKTRWGWVVFLSLIAGFIMSYQAYFAEPILDFDWRAHLRLEARSGITSGRIEKWTAVLESTEEHPLFGTGLGAKEAGRGHQQASFAELREERHTVENSYLDYLYETGYPGVFFLVVWILAALFAIWRNCFNNQDPIFRQQCQMAFAVCVNLLVISFFESFLSAVGNIMALVLWLLFGLATVQHAPRVSKQRSLGARQS